MTCNVFSLQLLLSRTHTIRGEEEKKGYFAILESNFSHDNVFFFLFPKLYIDKKLNQMFNKKGEESKKLCGTMSVYRERGHCYYILYWRQQPLLNIHYCIFQSIIQDFDFKAFHLRTVQLSVRSFSLILLVPCKQRDILHLNSHILFNHKAKEILHW